MNGAHLEFLNTIGNKTTKITLNEIKEFRRYNCTRVQLGVQHTDNEVLKKIKRGHSIEKVYYAIKLLKDNGYKVDIHLMPNLPGSSYELDKKMLESKTVLGPKTPYCSFERNKLFNFRKVVLNFLTFVSTSGGGLDRWVAGR